MTPTRVTDGKPSVLTPSGPGMRARRWYPHEALESVIGGLPGESIFDMEWAILDPSDAAAYLPLYRDAVATLTRFANMLEAIAGGAEPAVCIECSSRFYPSRSDARFCGSTCRMRAHRREKREG